MKKTIFAVVVLFALAGCDIGGIRGNGHLVTEQANLDPFINIDTGGAFRIEWHSGAPSAAITVDENLMQYIEMEVRDKVLHIRTTRSVRPTHSIRLTVTSNVLEGASFSGASRLDAHQLSGAKFYLETRGASNVTLDGAVDELVANMVFHHKKPGVHPITIAPSQHERSLRFTARDIDLTHQQEGLRKW